MDFARIFGVFKNLQQKLGAHAKFSNPPLSEHWKKKEREIAEEERKAPHSVDTLSKDASSITHINKPTKYEDFEAMTMEEKEASYKKFLEENKDKVKQFGFIGGGEFWVNFSEFWPSLG